MKLPTTYEKFHLGEWDIAVSSHGQRVIREGREVDELKWLAVGTKGLAVQIYPREPRTFPTRDGALSGLAEAIAAFDGTLSRGEKNVEHVDASPHSETP